nr:oxidoreductase C-terminal domain-containing protein [Ramlibacter aurantiacus]
MLGSAPPVPPFPWFWTEQGRHNIQMLGLPAAGLDYVRRGDPASGKALWIGHRGGVPMQGVALNAGGELRALRPLFDRARPVPMHEFAQDHLNLRAWAKQLLAEPAATL